MFASGTAFTCPIANGDYSAAKTAMEGMNSKEICLERLDTIYKDVDKDGDGVISRCEHASFQVAMGATEEYALKYSTKWSKASAELWCNMM